MAQREGIEALTNFASKVTQFCHWSKSYNPLAQITRKTSQAAENCLMKHEVLNGKQIWSPGVSGNPAANAFRHWKDHRGEFPNLQNAKQYAEQAHAFFRNPNKLSRIRPSDGSLLRYDLTSNTFASYTSKGVPKTMFKPQQGKMPAQYSTPLEYFYGQ